MPRKLDPGLEATYSKSSDLMTSTMKSPPGLSVVMTSPPSGGSASRAAMGADACGAAAVCRGSFATAAPGTRAAAPVTAALLRKSRRGREGLLDVDMLSASPAVKTPGSRACSPEEEKQVTEEN